MEKLDKDEVEQMSAMNAMMGIKKDCKAAQNIEVELKGPDGETETITLTAVKIGSKWFIHPLSLASLGM